MGLADWPDVWEEWMNGRPPTPMNSLTLSLFDQARDAEASRYRILAGLASARDAFTRNRVSPHLGDLIRLHAGLRALLAGADAVRPLGAAVGVDWQAGRLIREEAASPPLAVDLARWALPHIEGALVEGRTLYEFADEHAEIRAVGLLPGYRSEGFLLVTDGAEVAALRYRVSPITGPDGRYQALRTSHVDVSLDPLATPQTWKSALADAAPDLACPAAFQLQAEVELPVEETLVPIAKRKLLGMVHNWGLA